MAVQVALTEAGLMLGTSCVWCVNLSLLDREIGVDWGLGHFLGLQSWVGVHSRPTQADIPRIHFAAQTGRRVA